MIAAGRSKGFDALQTLRAAGYTFAVACEPTEPEKHPRTLIKVNGPEEPAPELAELIAEHRDALKAAALLSDPPAWLARLFGLWWNGAETPARPG